MSDPGNDKLRKIFDRQQQAQRKDLAGEYPGNDGFQVILLLLFLAIWITDSFFFKMTTFLAKYVPLLVRLVVGAAILYMWAYLMKAGTSIVFGEERPKPEVIRKGPFAYVRHPIYLASILFYLGLSCFTLSLASFAVTLLSAVYYNVAAAYEEKLLTGIYGDDYKQYMSEVPRWLPKIGK